MSSPLPGTYQPLNKHYPMKRNLILRLSLGLILLSSLLSCKGGTGKPIDMSEPHGVKRTHVAIRLEDWMGKQVMNDALVRNLMIFDTERGGIRIPYSFVTKGNDCYIDFMAPVPSSVMKGERKGTVKSRIKIAYKTQSIPLECTMTFAHGLEGYIMDSSFVLQSIRIGDKIIKRPDRGSLLITLRLDFKEERVEVIAK